MLLSSALKGMSRHREALREVGSACTPTYISEHRHRLAQYIAVVEDELADLEHDLEVKETASFHQHRKTKSVNASKESIRREFTKDRADIARMTRLVSSGWKVVSESQSRVKDLLAEAANQI